MCRGIIICPCNKAQPAAPELFQFDDPHSGTGLESFQNKLFSLLTVYPSCKECLKAGQRLTMIHWLFIGNECIHIIRRNLIMHGLS